MNNVLVPKVLQCLKDLNSESPYQTESNPLEIVILDKIVKIYRKQFERDYQVLPKDHIIFDSDYVE
jgi:hypothetical protein